MKSFTARLVKNTPLLHEVYLLFRDIYSHRVYVKSGSFSQHGEDKFLLEWFKDNSQGFFIDIGASHPFRISNTYALYCKGWRGLAVDPIPHFSKLYKKWRPGDNFLNIGIGPNPGKLDYFELTPSVLSSFDREYVQSVTQNGSATLHQKYKIEVTTPNQFFESNVGERVVDFLSLDVEGLDLSIIKSLDLNKYRPSLIAVEFNTQEDKRVLIEYLSGSNYDCSRVIGCNLFAADISCISERQKQLLR